jgi:putative nucleotidyltransferase with HDIG domain
MILTRHDWDTILTSQDADVRLEELQQDGTIRKTFPSLQTLVGFGGGMSGHKDLWAHTKQVIVQTSPNALYRWMALFHDVGKPQSFSKVGDKITFHHHENASANIFKRTAYETKLFRADEIDEITFVIRHLGHMEAYEPGWTDAAVRRLSKELGNHFDAVFAVAIADCTTARPEKRLSQLKRVNEIKNRIESVLAQDAVPPALPKGLGEALMQRLDLQPGPGLGNIMRALKARVEAGELPRNAPIEVYLFALKL